MDVFDRTEPDYGGKHVVKWTFLLWCFCGGVVVFLWCCGGVFCGGVFVVEWCGVFVVFLYFFVRGRLSSHYREVMQRVLTTLV